MAKKIYFGAEIKMSEGYDEYYTPYGPYPVPSIYFNGYQIINTGYNVTTNTGFELEFVPLSPNGQTTTAVHYLNAGGTGSATRIGLSTYDSSLDGEMNFGGSRCNAGLTQYMPSTVSLLNGVYTDPNGTTTTLSPSFSNAPVLIIGGTSSSKRCKMVFLRLKIYEGNTLVRDFIPTYDNGQFCVYDTVERKHYYPTIYSSKPLEGCVDSVPIEVKKAYVGVNGIARKIVKGYVGVNGVAQQFFGS